MNLGAIIAEETKYLIFYVFIRQCCHLSDTVCDISNFNASLDLEIVYREYN